jgi:signal transduction histidine kinase
MATVLIVEDEQIIALDMLQSLEEMGFEVVGCADTGHHALSLATELRPDIALLDIRIEGEIDGIETGRRLAELGIPFIYLTAYSDSQTVKRAAATAPFGFLTKPFQQRELAASMEVALAKVTLERAQRDLQRRVIAEQDQLLALIGEQIRDPLAVIQSAADSLDTLGANAGGPAIEQRYQRIARAAQRIDALVNLTTRRDSHGHVAAWDLSEIDLLELTQELRGSLPPDDQKRVTMSTAESMVPVLVQPDLLRFALLNLLDNALRYAPRSVVTLAVRRSAISDVVYLTVSDKGAGVPVAERQHIFEKYYRCPEHRNTTGLGLGLYIAKATIQRFGGQLQYVPLTQGASFEVTLPLHSAR